MDKKIVEEQVIMVIKTVLDPEIPVNIYELGLIYEINLKENKYTNIKSLSILERAKHCQHLYSEGMSVKDIAKKYNLSESRIRQYLKK